MLYECVWVNMSESKCTCLSVCGCICECVWKCDVCMWVHMCRFEQHVSQSPLTFNFSFSLTVQVCILQMIFFFKTALMWRVIGWNVPVTISIITNVLGFNLAILIFFFSYLRHFYFHFPSLPSLFLGWMISACFHYWNFSPIFRTLVANIMYSNKTEFSAFSSPCNSRSHERFFSVITICFPVFTILFLCSYIMAS